MNQAYNAAIAKSDRASLYFFATGAHLTHDRTDAVFVNGAHSVHRNTQSDESVFIGEPKPFFCEVWVEAAAFDAGDFKTNPFFLFGDPADSITFASDGNTTGDLTCTWHNLFPVKEEKCTREIVIEQENRCC